RLAEPAAAALWPGQVPADRKSRYQMALRQRANHREAGGQSTAQGSGARMSQPIVQAPAPVASSASASPWKRWFSLENRYLAPLFITCILLAGHLSFGILESYKKTLLAIVVSIVTEMVLGQIFFHKWLHPASAYISGISVGILVRSPAYWPYALC